MTPIPCMRAAGRVGKQWIIQRYPHIGQTLAYPYVAPTNPNSPAQQASRQRFADAMAAWKVLPAEEKAGFEYRARLKALTGKNIFIREYIAAHPLGFHQVDETGANLIDEQGNRWLP